MTFHTLVQPCINITAMSTQYLCQGKAEERDDAVASLIDDNAALAQIVGAHCCDIYARLY